ncbi:MAG: trypsin-like peptidase domain-containing protein [Oscillospiraceae bacterium]|nr:trypsin-like peptidase domain-containing protein [Oscillospiraceae bacterium]MBR4691281.1 trypsin-like peptidase domain-containing protein [Oscillospiraceae bacterium]
MIQKKLGMAALSGFALLLILALSLGLVRLACAGARLVPVSDAGRDLPAGSAVSSGLAAWGLEMDPNAIYEQSCAHTVYLYWTQKNENTGMTSTISGTGIVVSTDGYILTNAHCVADARTGGQTVNVEFYDGRSYEAAIVGCDSETEVALLKIDAAGLTAAPVDVSGRMKACDRVYVMGHPGDELKFTMTSGIVSGLDRSITFNSAGVTLHMFQFDAPVSPGNSGGPIYNDEGSVIGIVTAKYTALDSEGVGFAIPIGEALDVAALLRQYGYVTGRPLFGITVTNVHAGMLREDSPDGVLIHDVEPGLAADRAGLQPKDVIVGINGDVISSLEDLDAVKKQYHAFDTVVVRFWRMGEYMETKLTLDEVTPAHPTGSVPAPAEEAPAEDAGGTENADAPEEPTP